MPIEDRENYFRPPDIEETTKTVARRINDRGRYLPYDHIREVASQEVESVVAQGGITHFIPNILEHSLIGIAIPKEFVFSSDSPVPQDQGELVTPLPQLQETTSDR